MRELREAALAYARRGWPVLPCRADKTPLTTNGVLDATTDEAKLREWWERWPSANPAVNCGEAGLLVLDHDPGWSAEEVEAALGSREPVTGLVASTPRGGHHSFYALPDGCDPVASSVEPFARSVDVRSFHGYVLLPPSRTAHGRYDWVEEGALGEAPDYLLRVCRPAREKHPERDEWVIDPDLPENVDRAASWLRDEAQLAVEGRRGDDSTYAAAAMLKSLGVSEATALELLLEHWNPRCSPPWGSDDLAAKVGNGYRYNTSPPGNCTPAYHAARVAKMFKPTVEDASGGRRTEAGRFRFLDRGGLEGIEPPSWLVPDLIPEGGYGLMIGDRSSLKTFLALDVALTVASGGRLPWEGEEWRGMWEGPERPGSVLYVAGEGRSGILRRVRAWESYHRSGERCGRFYLADPVPRAADGSEGLRPFVEGALAMSPDGYRLVVMDTLGRAMRGLNENATEDAGLMNQMVEEMQRSLGAAVLVLHHTNKEGGVRGSGAFEADCDVAVMTSRPRSNSRFVRLSMLKPHKDAQEWEASKWAEAALVRVGLDEDSLAIKRAERSESSEADASFGAVDDRAYDVLHSHPLRPMSSRDLARMTASWRPREEGGERGETLGLSEEEVRRKWLPRLRSEPCKSRDCYDPSKDRWVYVPNKSRTERSD